MHDHKAYIFFYTYVFIILLYLNWIKLSLSQDGIIYDIKRMY